MSLRSPLGKAIWLILFQFLPASFDTAILSLLSSSCVQYFTVHGDVVADDGDHTEDFGKEPGGVATGEPPAFCGAGADDGDHTEECCETPGGVATGKPSPFREACLSRDCKELDGDPAGEVALALFSLVFVATFGGGISPVQRRTVASGSHPPLPAGYRPLQDLQYLCQRTTQK